MGIAKSLRSKVDRLISEIGTNKKLDLLAEPVAKAVGEVTEPPPIKNALSGTWLGHSLHPVLSDVPIGLWGAASALDLFGGEGSAKAARRLVGLGVLSVGPTAASGASDWSDTYGPERRIGLAHAVGNSVGMLLQATSWLIRRGGHRRVGAVVSLAGLGVTLGASYLGGHLTLVRGVGVNHTAFEKGPRKWMYVASESDISGSPMRLEILGSPVMLVKSDGVVRAISATCTHAGGPLDQGAFDAHGCVTCPWHGSKFRLDDGSVVAGPASVPQPAWDVKVEDGDVSIRLRSN